MNVFLGNKKIQLVGKRPKLGNELPLVPKFKGVHNTKQKFDEIFINKGYFFISTLPNVKSHACGAEVYDLEILLSEKGIDAKICHISSDGKSSWSEVKKLHPNLKGLEFSLDGCDKEMVQNFKESLGIGVTSSHRLAHGIFAYKDGKLVKSLIPKQQYGVPNIKKFINELLSMKKKFT
ncbi:hypothetical protein P3G55_05740 [Leptospira sp. 96542]|nr:hypothetical protein [Leptospira sp. 96542]